MSTKDQHPLLFEARAHAVTLIEDMLSWQVDLAESAREIAPDQVQAGRTELQAAVDAARRLVQSIDSATDARNPNNSHD